jgi:hypothetical protein
VYRLIDRLSGRGELTTSQSPKSVKIEVVKGDGCRGRPYGQGMRMIARWERERELGDGGSGSEGGGCNRARG